MGPEPGDRLVLWSMEEGRWDSSRARAERVAQKKNGTEGFRAVPVYSVWAG
jgi:hypothetical protein